MPEKKKQKIKVPRWLQILWGGFNAGVVMGIVDGLMIMFFGLAQFDRTGEIVGFLFWDALGLGLLGLLCSAFVFLALGRVLRTRPRILSVLNLVLLFLLSSTLTIMNVGWSFRSIRGCPPENARNILLITLDTLRSDSIGMGGHPFVRTPWLDELARNSRQFMNAACPVPMTTPSHASMLTSTIPAVHGASENRYRLHPTNETMTEILRNTGYRTAAFVSCFPLDSRFGLDQGFMLYHDQFNVPGDLRQASWFLALANLCTGHKLERNCRWTNSLAIPWIRKYTGDGVPFFLWIHYFDPHAPYNPPIIEQQYYSSRVTPNYKQYPNENALNNAKRAVRYTDIPPDPGRPEELYLGEVSEMDRGVGEIIKQLLISGVLDNSLIAILADHGESFGEHGYFYTHGEDIYEPALSIPMLFFSGFNSNLKGLDTRLACGSDIASTILPAVGLLPGRTMEGFDLLDHQAYRHMALIENFGIIMCPGAVKQRGIRTTRYKLVHNLGRDLTEMFDLENDPSEARNIADESAELTQDYLDLVTESFTSASARKSAVSEDLSPDTLQKLETLGYVVPSQ
ncbi:sulfatase [bacterium]|nr:sulfatase [candidate division CSSED10-310 bacterium]